MARSRSVGRGQNTGEAGKYGLAWGIESLIAEATQRLRPLLRMYVLTHRDGGLIAALLRAGVTGAAPSQ